MANDEGGEKSELPTERRRTQAREEGNIARSTDLNVAIVTLASVGALWFTGWDTVQALAKFLGASLSAEPWIRVDPAHVWLWWQQAALTIGTHVLPLMLLIAAGALASNLLQVGFLWAPDVLLPKFSRLNPLQGLQRIVSLQAFAKLGSSVGKLLVLGSVGVAYFYWKIDNFQAISQHTSLEILVQAGYAWVELGFYLALSLIGLALFDYGYQFWKHEQDLKMTKQEVREEMKEMEGDPHIRMRRREIHRKLAEGRQLQDVRTADVIITNPTHLSIAIKYDPAKMQAPIVVAKGQDEMALQIRRIANEHGVPIIERKSLAQALYKQVKVGQAIPVDLYEVFVEILAYVYKITGRKPPMMA